MEEKKNYREGKVTQKLFEAVKICLDSGNSIAETSRFMKLNKSVVALIRNAEDFDDYKRLMYARAKACHAKKTEEKKSEEKPEEKSQENKPDEIIKEIRSNVTIQATHHMESQITEAVELLKGISAKLAYIVEDLYGTNAKT